MAMAICLAGCGIAAHRSDYFSEADAALSALRQWLADEWLVVVPGEATEEMVEAGYAAPDPTLGELVKRQLRTVQMKKAYTAMISAAPDALETKP
jgi:hypothetical protein